MADIRTALRTRLLAAEGGAPVAIGGRVDWQQRPQEDALPALVLQMTADPRPEHFKGPQLLRGSRFQLDAWSGADLAEAIVLAEWAAEVLRPAGVVAGVRIDRVFVEGPVDGGEQLDTLYAYRGRLDCSVWWALV